MNRMRGVRMAWLAMLAAAGWGVTVAAEGLEGVASGARADLAKALEELTVVRQQVESERLPLARRVTELEQQLAEAREALTRAQRFQDNQLVELNALKAEARARSNDVAYVESLVSEYGRAFRSRLGFVEEPRYRDMLEQVDQAAVAADLTSAERFERRSVLLSRALERVEAQLGGEVIEARALDKQGRVQSGQVALVGPVALFADGAGKTVGLLQQELNKSDPTVVAVEPALVEPARGLVTGGSGMLVVDPTLGNAFKLSALKESLFEKIAEGGLVMIPLIGLGLAAVGVAGVKFLQLSRVRLATERDLQTVLGHLREGARDRALGHARGIPGLAGEMLATAVEHASEKKEYIEEVVYEKMLGARARLERGIPFLALCATTGPLMGLLGTVMGMIATFKLISSFGSGDPRLLAAGISEALIATATGMIVAVPSLLLHAFLSRKAKTILGSMEQVAVGFVNGVPEGVPAESR